VKKKSSNKMNKTDVIVTSVAVMVIAPILWFMFSLIPAFRNSDNNGKNESSITGTIVSVYSREQYDNYLIERKSKSGSIYWNSQYDQDPHIVVKDKVTGELLVIKTQVYVGNTGDVICVTPYQVKHGI